ncbi:winged helix DNA-binding domain-containing protein [Luethyella okanaganae]|uniref:Winged helix DNA-binding domain-containing protein n=1 Tax=Luethyella okanaganae TaxID=69372 RepID=A0ABW1VFT2_9MICO
MSDPMSATTAEREIARLRSEAQGLGGGGRTPTEVVERLLALQAQDLAAAKWAVATRAGGSTEQDIDGALARGEIIRSWPMRGTLHLVPARDLGWMLELTTSRLLAQASARHRQLELDGAAFEQAREIAIEALWGGRELSRAGFMQLLESHGMATKNQRGYHIIWVLAQTGTLCWGRVENGSQTLVLLDEWAPEQRRLERDESLGEFLRRYVRGHGPATLQDFVWWSKLTMADAKIGLAVARADLQEYLVDGTSYWISAETDASAPSTAGRRRFAASLRALPAFDEYFLGYQRREAVIDERWADRIVPGRNGVFQPIVVAGGRVVGTWRRAMNGGSVSVEAFPFAPLSAVQTAGFEREARRYARFLGKKLVEGATAKHPLSVAGE